MNKRARPNERDTKGTSARQLETPGRRAPKERETTMNNQRLTAWQVFCFFGALVCVVWMLLHFGVIGR